MLELSPFDIFYDLAIPQNSFQGDELPLLEGLGELGEIPPGIDAMPFGAVLVVAFVVLPALLGGDVEDEREMILARWGLVPFFTKDLNDVKGLSTINARSETITKAPTWREPFKKRRCLIPTSFFYEWQKEGKPPKQPYAFELGNSSLFAFAGLWDAWKDKDGY